MKEVIDLVDGRMIKSLREEEGLTTFELATKVFTSQAMISQVENGIKKPSVELLKRIADYFGRDINYFLKDSQ